MNRQRYQALLKSLPNTLSDQEYNVRYATERFLARLQRSPYKDNFILKGGFLLGSLYDLGQRTTQDLDTLMKNISNNVDVVKTILEEILKIDLEDNVHFDLINIQQSTTFKEYPGLKANIQMSFLDAKAFFNFFLDIGIGDSVTPNPQIQEIPLVFNVTKDKKESLELYTYPKETILAEKTEAILNLGIQTSRMKDFYDLHLLLLDDSLPPIDKLYDALNNTWEFRHKETISEDFFDNALFIISRLRIDKKIQQTAWPNYSAKHDYAKDLLLPDILDLFEKYIHTLEIEYQKRTL